jgi:hypothetical protein
MPRNLGPKRVRVVTSFTTDSDHQIEETTGKVITGVYGNKAFPSPPVDAITLKTTLTDFTVAIAAAAQGGVHATNEKNKKRHELTGLLHQLAIYVQANCNNDLATVTSSGFRAASNTRAQMPLPKPVITGIDNGHSTQLVMKVQKVPTAKAYEVEVATINGNTIGPWQKGGVFTKSRGMIVTGLTPAVTYTVHVRAVGGTTGFSDWSDPVVHMCM